MALTPVPLQDREDELTHRVGVTFAAGIGARFISLAVSIASVPILLSYLGTERYGVWAAIASVVAALSISDLGIGNGLLNALTASLGRHDYVRARASVTGAFIALSVIAGLLLVVLAATARWLPWSALVGARTPELAAEMLPVLAVMCSILVVGLPLTVALSARQAREEGYVVHILSGLGSGIGLGILALTTHYHLPTLGIAAAVAVVPLALAAGHFGFLFGREVPWLRPRLPTKALLRTGLGLVKSGLLFSVLQLAIVLAVTSDSLVVAAIVGPEGVTEYSVVSRLAAIPIAIAATYLTALWPAYGRAIAIGDIAWVRRRFKASMRAVAGLSLVSAIVLGALGPRIIRLWVGPEVSPPMSLFLLFSAWVMLSSVGSATATLLNAANEIRVQALCAAVMAITNLVLSIVLTSTVGTPGVLIATVVTYSLLILLPMAFYVPRVVARLERSRLS